MKQSLSQKISQGLVFSKQMQQSLKILQMTTPELLSEMQNEALNNPFLEVELREDLVSNTVLVKNENAEVPEQQNQWQEENYLRYEKNFKISDSSKDFLSNYSNDNISLKEHLTRQLSIELTDPKPRFVGLYVTDLLDDNGYLLEGAADICNNIKVSEAMLNEVLLVLRKLDPIGCYAFDLKECLTLQLKENGFYNDKFALLLDNLGLIAKGEVAKLQKLMGVTEEKLKRMIVAIKELDPKPGRNFGTESTRTNIADAFINITDKGDIKVTLNTENLPKIFVNSKYFESIFTRTKAKEEKKFCTDKLQSANFIVRAVAQRNESLLKITSEIANRQFDFFRKGVSYLRPMTLNDISKEVGLHESTVSRISNKIIATPMGVFELKYFFSNSLSSSITDDQISTKAVKLKIKELIDKETIVIADDEIAKVMFEQGIKISRRTVAKYREQMQIPASNIRRRLKAVC
ncbi:MAG: RNA polymerase factor sigma-54 [Rickettsiales bacterium]